MIDWELHQYDSHEGSTYVRRLKVPGGWLYQISFSGPPKDSNFQTPVFVPDVAEIVKTAIRALFRRK